MNTELFETQQGNILISLAYFNLSQELSKNYYLFIQQYKDYSKEYLQKISFLYKDFSSKLKKVIKTETKLEKSPNQPNEKTDTNSLDNSDNQPDKSKEKEKNQTQTQTQNQTLNKHLNILPALKFVNSFLKIFQEQILGLEVFVKMVELSLEELKTNINSIYKEIGTIKTSYLNEKENFLKSYSIYEIDNPKLLEELLEVENNIKDYCIKKKDKSINPKELENKMNLKMIQAKTDELKFLEKLNLNKNCGHIFYEKTNNLLNEIKKRIFTLFSLIKGSMNTFINCSNNYSIINQSEIDLQIKKLKNETTTKDFENLINKEIENNINKNLINIKNLNKIQKNNKNCNSIEKKCEFIPKYYNIKSIHDQLILKNDFSEEFKGVSVLYEEFGFEEVSKEFVVLTEEDVYFITKKLYDNYQMVNKSEYDLKIELHKIQINNLVYKLMSYHSEQKKIIENYSGISESDYNILKNDMEIKEYRRKFLQKLNNLRAVGIFEVPLKQFNYLTEIFYTICDKIKNENESKNKNKNFIDEESCKFIIALSFTFYYVNKDENNEKIYIVNKIKNHPLFHTKDFWKKYEINVINNEFRKAEKTDKLNERIMEKDRFEKRNTNIVFAQLLALISNMNGLDISENIKKDVVLPLIDIFQIENDKKEAIISMISSK